jgi:predicted small lipoprotein YifL
MQGASRTGVGLAAVALLALALAGCGYKGALDPPPEAKEQAARPKTTDPADRNTPDKPFILDRVIR